MEVLKIQSFKSITNKGQSFEMAAGEGKPLCNFPIVIMDVFIVLKSDKSLHLSDCFLITNIRVLFRKEYYNVPQSQLFVISVVSKHF